MDYRYLKAFMLTAECLSFSKAAQELGIAQSAVSRQIKLLEESVAHELIIRSSKKIILTEKGKELFWATQHFEKNVHGIFYDDETKEIRIGVLHGLLETWFTGILTEYSKKYSNNLVIRIDSPANLKKAIMEGQLDMAISIENIQNELVSSLKLFTETHVLISSKEIDPEHISEHTWIVYDDFNHFFRYYKKRSNHIYKVTSVTAITQLVKNGVGIAIVPDHMLKSDDQLYRYELNALSNETVYATTLNFKNIPQYLKNLIELIKS